MSGVDLDRYIGMYRSNVTDAALFIVKNPADAEDIAQDVFLKLYTYSGTFNDDEHVRAWLIRCAMNSSLNYIKSYRYKNSVPLDELPEIPDSTANADSGLKDGMMSLAPKFRAALYLHYYEGYTAKETAALLGISTAAVKWRLKRGRDKLREFLNDERG